MKSTTVRGTPYRHFGTAETAHQGIRPQLPVGNKGTVDKLNAEPGIRTGPEGPGTPYHSEAGNGPEFSRTRSQGKYGEVQSNSQGDANNPKNNGDGVVLDHVRADYEDPTRQPTMDSPVPTHAAVFDTGTIVEENEAHLGRGRGPTAPNEAMKRDDLLAIGGVMSRGMDSTSQSSQPEDELTRDDVFSKGGAGSRPDNQTPPRR